MGSTCDEHSGDERSLPASPTSTDPPKFLPSGEIKCRFNDCDNAAAEDTDKCEFHKNRRQCKISDCTNQVYARKLCVRHGGKKQCQTEGCEAHARGGGYCLQHGGFVVKRFCLVEGCSRQAHARQKCVRHGGGRRCKVEGCLQHARAGGLCNRHSHGHQCRIDGCNKTAQHSGSICFRHAMELRAHGEQVPELNISKGGRLSSKKRMQLQQEQQLKQEQFHHQQLQEQQTSSPPPPPQQPQQQSQHQQSAPTTSQAPTASNPFGLPLKINVPATVPKFSTMRTPSLGGFPTPHSHDFSFLMGIPSPQIDISQLPSVLAMANQQNRSIYEPPSSFMTHGPPSLSRGSRLNFLSPSVLFPTPTQDKHPSGTSMTWVGGQEEESSDSNKFVGTIGGASPLPYHPQQHPLYHPGQHPHSPHHMLEHMFDNPIYASHTRQQQQMPPPHGLSPMVHGVMPHLQRLIPPHGFEGYAGTSGTSGAPMDAATGDYTAQFFSENTHTTDNMVRTTTTMTNPTETTSSSEAPKITAAIAAA